MLISQGEFFFQTENGFIDSYGGCRIHEVVGCTEEENNSACFISIWHNRWVDTLTWLPPAVEHPNFYFDHLDTST